MNKKAISTTGLLAAIVIMALLILVVYFAFISPISEVGGGVKALGPSKDKICKVDSTGDFTDIDGDGRDDDKCDSCVCKTGCHNDDDDEDHDKLPKICDEDDKDPNVLDFNTKNCPEDKLIKLLKVWGMQCRP